MLNKNKGQFYIIKYFIVFLFKINILLSHNVIDGLDIERFMGRWYVISLIPNWIEEGATNSYEDYVLNDDGTIGVVRRNEIRTINKKLGLFESIVQGFNYGYWTLYEYVAGFSFVFTKKGASQLGGFGTIGNIFPAKWDWKGFWLSTALISIILAFMNVLPIPALDGGHVMFLIYEMVSGRKPSDRFMEVSTMIGFFILIAIVLYANGNDIVRAFAN